MASVIELALKPLLVAKASYQFGIGSIYIVIQTWLELLRFSLSLHFLILWRLVICSIALLSLPVRAFTALYRETLLEMKLDRLKNEMEELLWDRKELEEQLHAAIKERKMMEMMLMELEEEHDEAILKIQLLQGEVQDLKNEMQRLKEVQCKALWRFNTCTPTDNMGKRSSWKPDLGNKNIRQGSKDDVLEKVRSICSGGVAEEREVALSRSLFSTILSFVVGIVVWESKESCLPLVVALFTVVTMSLTSALRLFTRIEHKPASQSVTLLSINCFLLGTLAYPILPTVARFFASIALSYLQRTFKWIGL